jgi:predicted HicB family RNase H-like nuclease
MMKKEPTQTMTIRVPISLHLQLQIAAHKDSRTINSLVNKILSEYVWDAKK